MVFRQIGFMAMTSPWTTSMKVSYLVHPTLCVFVLAQAMLKLVTVRIGVLSVHLKLLLQITRCSPQPPPALGGGQMRCRFAGSRVA